MLKMCNYSKDIKEAWHGGKTVRQNMREMGLSYDPNETIKLPSTKEKLKLSMKSNENEWKIDKPFLPRRVHVANKLESDAKAPRVKLFRLPKGQVEWITYLMDKYGTDYKAMVRDKKNYYQETWKQLRAKINRFKSIPEQHDVYLREKGLENVNSD